jgi:hypothetical protein
MPGNVAVDDPRARVIWLESNSEVSVCWEHGDVAARRVVKVECCRGGVFVVFGVTLTNNGEVVALGTLAGTLLVVNIR